MKSRYADKTILVVDDDAMNLKVARFVLEQKGYNVMTVSSGAEMPGMNGMKTLEHIRETREYRKIPVMFLTADASKDTVISAGKLDVAGYVKKPYDPQELLERIKKIFNEDL